MNKKLSAPNGCIVKKVKYADGSTSITKECHYADVSVFPEEMLERFLLPFYGAPLSASLSQPQSQPQRTSTKRRERRSKSKSKKSGRR